MVIPGGERSWSGEDGCVHFAVISEIELNGASPLGAGRQFSDCLKHGMASESTRVVLSRRLRIIPDAYVSTPLVRTLSLLDVVRWLDAHLGPIMGEQSTYGGRPKPANCSSSASEGSYVRACDVLIIGAGPYGLSISTHLRERGIDHLIVGRPMDAWRSHMPADMFLKSEPYGTDMSCPQTGYDLEGYSRSENIGGIERGTPLPLDQFLNYADWYIKHLVPDVCDVTATEVKAVSGGFASHFPMQSRLQPGALCLPLVFCRIATFRPNCRACPPSFSRIPLITACSTSSGTGV